MNFRALWPFGSVPRHHESNGIEVNWERVLVMEQRRFITMKLEIPTGLPPECGAYVDAVRIFNAAFDDHRQFEIVYSSGMQQRTRENALILDQKHEALTSAFNALKPAIIHARAVIQRQTT